jgi:uncharacterized protein DUF4230
VTASQPSSKSGGRRWYGGIALALLVLLLIWGAGRGLVRLLPGALWPRSNLVVRASLPTVVEEIRSLARLETAAGTMQQVVEGERSVKPLPAWLIGDRILFVAQGEAIAGVDLTQLRPEDVRVVAGRVHVRLPEPALFSVHLDEPNCRVYDRTVGWLNRPDPELESRVRQRAVEKLTEAAYDQGLLTTARENARTTVAQLLHRLGARDVVFD